MATIDLIDEWEKDFKDILLENKLLGKDDWSDIYCRIKNIFDAVKDEIKEVEALPVVHTTNKIDTLGLGPRILEMVRDQVPIPIIANALSTQLNITIKGAEIDKWIINYNRSNDRMVRPSVFETSSRLEDIHKLIFEHMDYVQSLNEDDFKAAKTTKAQVMLEVYKELRMLYKDANQLVASIKQLESIKEFQESVLSVIQNVSPAHYHLIIKRLNEKKALMSSFTP
jgi:GTPase SAR1 family protein